jgi:uncharacterized membrane protein
MTRQSVELLALAGGGLLAGLALSPFLFHFARNTSGAGMSFRAVPWEMHTPPILGVILLAPALLVLVASFLDKPAPVHRTLAWFWIACFVISEALYVDDLYSGKFTRFNTTLKWWGWTYAGALLTTAPLNLESKSWACRLVTLIALVMSCGYAWDLGHHFFMVPKPHAGRLDGAATLTDDPTQRSLIAYLRTQPASVVLQRPDKGSYSLIPGVAMFSGHNAFVGWPDHERVWRGSRPQIQHREIEMRYFYDGSLPGPLEWLRWNHIDHVVWLNADSALNPGVWEKLNPQLAPEFEWHEIGIWSRKR